MPEGLIFNIQKFSIHDGPGIRTTVFLKGCPLRCLWCSNPESQSVKREITWDETKCSHCLQCLTYCLDTAITHEDHKIVINSQQIESAYESVKHCPTQALHIEGEYQSVADVVSVCLQDQDFYEESNGGVTISGGEGLLQPEFVKALVLQLKEHHIHVAIETTGVVSTTVFKKLAPIFDLLLFDMKHFDAQIHLQQTGVSNEQSLNNLIWAVEQQLPILPRIPVIPNVNDSLMDAKGFCQLLKKIGLTRVQLLPFHQFGEKKYTLLQRTYALTNISPLHPEDLYEYQQVFIKEGIDCFF